LLGLARLPKNKVETGVMAYIAYVPKSKVIKYAKIARKEKEKGNKNYVEVLNKKIKDDHQKEIKAAKSNEKRWQWHTSEPDPKNSAVWSVKKGGKNFTKGNTPSIVNKYLKANIRKSQQLTSNLIKPNDGETYYYEREDLIKVPKWMKSTKAFSKKKPKSITKYVKTHTKGKIQK
jgi:hypothetical protein